MPPNLASATRLLGNQNVRWQDLTKAQQNSVVALANNKKRAVVAAPGAENGTV